MRVTVVYSPAPRKAVECVVDLAEGANVAQALQASAMADDAGDLSLSIWGRKASATDPLRDMDRVEICRALLVDPKVARRERFREQGARSAGLFAKKRPGAKAGY